MVDIIDKIDKHIIFELERNARIPIVKLAKIVGKSKDAVKYRIKKLEASGIIKGYRAWVDYAKLGYNSSTLTFQLVTLPQRRREFIGEIKNDRRVSWIGVGEGVWNVQATYAYKTNQDIYAIKNDLLSRYQDIILNIEITSIVSVYVHEKTFLIDKTSKFIPFIDTITMVDLDGLSKKILHELFTDGQANIAHIASKLNTTIDIVRLRMRKLEDSHVIIRYTAIIDFQKIGYDLYKSTVYLKSSTAQEIDSIVKYAEHSDKIIHLVKQIAPWDIELIIFTKNFAEYHKFIAVLTERFSKQIRKIDTTIMNEDVVLPSKNLIFE